MTSWKLIKSQRGVSIIEMMVALLVTSLGVLGLVGVLARTVAFVSDAEDRNKASVLAAEMATQIWLLNAGNTGPIDTAGTAYVATLANWQAAASNPARYGLTIPAASPPQVAVSNRTATITVTWKAPQKDSTWSNNVYTTQVVLP